MVLKKRGKNKKVLKLEALMRRLPPSHQRLPRIKEELANRRSGERGENSLDYHLTFLPKKVFNILHDLRLKNEHGYYFQIDTLLLSPNFFIILDAKNYGGHILFDKIFNQVIQESYNGDKRALQNPIAQAERQRIQLVNWLTTHGFQTPPIEPLIVMSNPSTMIETTDDSTHFKQIIQSINLEGEIEYFQQKNKDEIFSKKEIYRLANLLIKKHTPETYAPLKQFQIQESELLKGVHCPGCSFLPMKRVHGSWECPSCHFLSKDAHLKSLVDYSLLIGNTITNQRMCEFLILPNRFVANRLLNTLKLPHDGGTRYRRYVLAEV